MQGIDVEELPGFLKLSLELEPAAMKRFFSAIDLKTATEHWPRLFKERAKVRRRARQVLRMISEHSQGSTKELAQSVLATALSIQVLPK
jgi:hypothetical protein